MTIDTHMESQYNARAAVPEHVDILAGWQRRSEALRERRACELDLAYGEGERQRIDLFRCGESGAPLHVFIHGGYWQRGDRRANHFVAEGLSTRGVDVALVGYDLCPEVSLDDIVAQVRAAIAWLWRHAPSLGFDAERLQVCGHSAGGHLTAMLMATPWPSMGADLPASLIHSAIGISGLYALGPLRHTSINEAVGMDADTARRNSPALLRPTASASMVAAVGGLESEEFHRQAQLLAEAWQGGGAPVTTLDVPGTNHFTILEELAGDGVLLERALALLGAT